MRKPRVYIAGPLNSSGEPAVNAHVAAGVGIQLLKYGFAPYVPHLSLFWQFLLDPQPNEVWIELGLEWIVACDAVLRLPGVSSGADREVALARERGIPVFYSLDTLYAWKETFREASAPLTKAKHQ